MRVFPLDKKQLLEGELRHWKRYRDTCILDSLSDPFGEGPVGNTGLKDLARDVGFEDLNGDTLCVTQSDMFERQQAIAQHLVDKLPIATARMLCSEMGTQTLIAPAIVEATRFLMEPSPQDPGFNSYYTPGEWKKSAPTWKQIDDQGTVAIAAQQKLMFMNVSESPIGVTFKKGLFASEGQKCILQNYDPTMHPDLSIFPKPVQEAIKAIQKKEKDKTRSISAKEIFDHLLKDKKITEYKFLDPEASIVVNIKGVKYLIRDIRDEVDVHRLPDELKAAFREYRRPYVFQDFHLGKDKKDILPAKIRSIIEDLEAVAKAEGRSPESISKDDIQAEFEKRVPPEARNQALVRELPTASTFYTFLEDQGILSPIGTLDVEICLLDLTQEGGPERVGVTYLAAQMRMPENFVPPEIAKAFLERPATAEEKPWVAVLSEEEAAIKVGRKPKTAKKIKEARGRLDMDNDSYVIVSPPSPSFTPQRSISAGQQSAKQERRALEKALQGHMPHYEDGRQAKPKSTNPNSSRAKLERQYGSLISPHQYVKTHVVKGAKTQQDLFVYELNLNGETWFLPEPLTIDSTDSSWTPEKLSDYLSAKSSGELLKDARWLLPCMVNDNQVMFSVMKVAGRMPQKDVESDISALPVYAPGKENFASMLYKKIGGKDERIHEKLVVQGGAKMCTEKCFQMRGCALQSEEERRMLSSMRELSGKSASAGVPSMIKRR